VQLSDFHYDTTPLETIQSAIDAANALDADAVALTGDYITRSYGDEDACASEIGRLRAKHGVYGALGNHDIWSRRPEQISRALQVNGVTMLINQSFPIERDGARMWIIGADDGWERRSDPELALRGVPAGETKVLLLHEPDFADEAAHYGFDLQLSGHSHGGQVRLPLIGAPMLPRYGRKYPIGLRRIGTMQLYTTRGVGVVQPAVRFNCRPEVTLITLRSV
jgi:hypothetical protein